MLKTIAKGFGLLVLLAIAFIYGKYFLFKWIDERAAVENVNKRYAAARIEGERALESRVSRLQKLGIIGEKVAESRSDTCYINEVYAGFTTATWNQHCQLDFVAGYTALLSRQETFDRLQTLPKRWPKFKLYSHPAVDRCDFRMTPFWELTMLALIPAENAPKNDSCSIPNPLRWIKPSSFAYPRNTVFETNFDPDAIDPSLDLVWITYSERYHSEDLGCRPGLFCMHPSRRKLIQANQP